MKSIGSVLHICGLTVVLALFAWAGSAQAVIVTQLDLMGGSSSYDGKFHRVLDRLIDQDGAIVMGQYQPVPDIVSPITKGHKTFSLFTSGVSGADAPSATIDGSSITVDLSSLFFGVSRGDSLRAWNIGGLARGLFNPETSEFMLSWNHVIGNDGFKTQHGWSHDDQAARFFLQGKVVLDPTPVPLPVSFVIFVTGLVGVVGFLWWNRRTGQPGVAA
jgi:hypothetical protein